MSLNDLVDQKELNVTWEKLYQQLRKQFGTDDEGEISKVTLVLVDRSRCESFHFEPVPYLRWKMYTESDYDHAMNIAMCNLRIAADTVDRLHRGHEFDKNMAKEERAKKPKVPLGTPAPT